VHRIFRPGRFAGVARGGLYDLGARLTAGYTLRAQYRQGGTMAFFPAEVLVSLYRTLGDLRDVLVIASALNDVLIFAAVTILLLALAGLRRRRYAVLRALGASRGYSRCGSAPRLFSSPAASPASRSVASARPCSVRSWSAVPASRCRS